ncbi:MAG: DegT/DnrJ/EryC1/StrS family aminotransferase [Pseudomonadota bacterium]
MHGRPPTHWEFVHDEVSYNYRLPNINAAVGCAQMESFASVLENKCETARIYQEFFEKVDVSFISEPENAQSNYWLNAIVLMDRKERDAILEASNASGVQTRPVWALMNHLPMYSNCQTTTIDTAQWLEDRLINIPSSVRKDIAN